MFGFLNSTVLFAAAAAVIPLLIHLFSRRRVKVVEFSSLKHLKQMQRRQVRRIKIRQLLLLILRTLIILSIVLAFARPTMKSGAVGSHATVSAVVLFDNSVSMDRFVVDGNLFEIARQRAEQILSTFTDADQIALVPLCDEAGQQRSISFGSAALALKQLELLQPEYRVGDFTDGLLAARSILEDVANFNRELYIITDGQRVSLPEFDETKKGELWDDIRICPVSLPTEAVDNVGVVKLGFGGRQILPGHDFELSARLKNYNQSASSQVMASLYLDGNRVSQQDVTIDPTGETTIRFVRSVSRTGFHTGYIEISDDPFMADNRFYFSFSIPDQFNVLVVTNGLDSRLLTLALVPDQQLKSFWSIKQVAPDQLGTVDLVDFDVIILPGTPIIRQTHSDRIKSFVRSGGALFLTYASSTDIENFNTVWSDFAGLAIEQGMRVSPNRSGFYSLQSLEADHPIFSAFDFDKGGLPDLKFYDLPRVTISDDASVHMSFSGDRPALIETSADRGRILTLAGPVEPGYSDIAGHAFFVPFVSRIVEYLTAELSEFSVDHFVGEKITRPLDLRGPTELPPIMTSPDSIEYRLSGEEVDGGFTVEVAPIRLPGIYRIEHLDRQVDRLAVNLDPLEGDLMAADINQLAAASGFGEYHIIEEDVQVAGFISELRTGRELWQLFLVMALIFVFLEMLIARGVGFREQP